MVYGNLLYNDKNIPNEVDQLFFIAETQGVLQHS